LGATVRRAPFLQSHLVERIPPYHLWTWACDDCAAGPWRDRSATEGVARRSALRHNRTFHGRYNLDDEDEYDDD